MNLFIVFIIWPLSIQCYHLHLGECWLIYIRVNRDIPSFFMLELSNNRDWARRHWRCVRGWSTTWLFRSLSLGQFTTNPSTQTDPVYHCKGKMHVQNHIFNIEGNNFDPITYCICKIMLFCLMPLFCWIFSSPEPKAQVSFSDQNLSVVCPCRCCKLLTFSFLLQNHWTHFNQRCQKASLNEGDSILDLALSQGEIITK